VLRELQTALDELSAAVKKVEAILEAMRARHDPLASHIFVARHAHVRATEKDGKSGKFSERMARVSYREALDLGFRGGFEEWHRLLGAVARR
jgi:hypothetical protein